MVAISTAFPNNSPSAYINAITEKKTFLPLIDIKWLAGNAFAANKNDFYKHGWRHHGFF
jgi:hypothetical protein